TILALNLAQLAPTGASIHLIERDDIVGPGLAYADGCGDVALNVPTARMSAWPDRPSHFLDWLRLRLPATRGELMPNPGGFVPRELYGRYIRDLLAEGLARDPAGRLTLFQGQIVSVTSDPLGMGLTFSDGRRARTQVAVLATGHH